MEEKEIGTIAHYYGKLSVGIIDLVAPLKVGDTIHIKGAHDNFSQRIESMQVEHKEVAEANQGDAVGIKVIQRVHPNDKVYKIIE